MEFNTWIRTGKSRHRFFHKDGEKFYYKWADDFSRITLNNFILDNNSRSLVDFIIKYENLENDFMEVCERLRIPPTSLATLEETVHDDYRSYYNDVTRIIIEKQFHYDIQVGEYVF